MNETGTSARELALGEAHLMSGREVFLLEMYKQCSAHLNRHVTSLWQSLAVIVAAAAAITLNKNNVALDYATSVAILICAWFAASALDASAWFNRNIIIITNIERLFLNEQDAVLVHPFFVRPHKHGNIIQNFRLHLYLAGSVALLLVAWHISERYLSCADWKISELPRLFPLFLMIASAIYLRRLWSAQSAQQHDINLRSPGKRMGASGEPSVPQN